VYVCECVSLIVVMCNNNRRKADIEISWTVDEGETVAASDNGEVAKAVHFG
jgi:hypothetical protein